MRSFDLRCPILVILVDGDQDGSEYHCPPIFQGTRGIRALLVSYGVVAKAGTFQLKE